MCSSMVAFVIDHPWDLYCQGNKWIFVIHPDPLKIGGRVEGEALMSDY